MAPVAERTVATTTCATPARACGVVDRRTVYTPECSSCRWVQPDRNNLAYGIGNVLTFPFRAITGRQLGQPDVVATHQISEPLARRACTDTTRTTYRMNRCGDRVAKKVTLSRECGLEPVGERLTTVKVIRLKPMPIAERCETLPACPPVAERICPAPVAERICPAPVAERTIIRSCPSPVMERFSCPSYNYPNYGDSCNSCW